MSDVISISPKTDMQRNPAPAPFLDLVATTEAILHDALNASGCSFEFAAMKFSRNFDKEAARLSEDAGQELLALAQKAGFYVTESEADMLTRGCCEHGIDLGFCPAGCD